jgi:pilus assembly protein CpaC
MNRRCSLLRSFALACAIACATVAAPDVWAASQIVRPTGAPITVDVSKGVIVRLDRPCSSVFVADPDIADVQLKSPTVLYIMGKGAGSTTIYAVDQQDTVLLNSVVNVQQDVGRLARDIRQIDPSGHVVAKAVDDSIVLEGTVKDAAQGDDIRKMAARYVANPTQVVNRLKIDAPNQIDLHVRVAEVQRSVLKQFGINWAAVGQGAAHDPVFGLISAGSGLSLIPTSPGSSSFGNNLVPNGTLIGNALNNNLFATYQSSQVKLNALIDALAQNGLITILAEPNLVTVSGQKASFLAGGEFPIPIAQGGTSNSVTIEWKQFGVSLNFTPTILADGRIGLHVAPEVSQLAPQDGITVGGVSIPGLTTRRADTTVELGSGQSFAIAGLLQNQTQQQIQAYPWIGDIPIIGSLFRSTAFQRGETELMILVTPYLVNPVSSATALQTSNDGFYAPNDADRVFKGSVNSTPNTDAALAKPAASAGPGTAKVDGATPVPRKPVAAPVALPAPGAKPSGSADAGRGAAVAATAPTALEPTPKAGAPARAAASGFEID